MAVNHIGFGWGNTNNPFAKPKKVSSKPAVPQWTAAALQAFANRGLPVPGYTKGAPTPGAKPNPPAAPFLTGDQELAQGQATYQHDYGVQQIKDQLAQLMLNSKYQQAAIEKGRVQGVSNTQDDAAARGIFSSSIKDAGIYDIDAQAATAQQQLKDQISAAQTAATANIGILDNALTAAQTAFNDQAVANGAAIDTGWTAPPPAPVPPPAPKPPAPSPGYHSGHTPNHEYYLPGVGWVSHARYKAGR